MNIKYNTAGVTAIEKMEKVIASFGLPVIRFTKLNGLLNAIEVQIEDHDYDAEIVRSLDKVLVALIKPDISEKDRLKLENAVADFERTL